MLFCSLHVLVAHSQCPSEEEILIYRENFGAGPNFGPDFNDNTTYNYGAIGPGNYQVTNTTGLNGGGWHIGPDHTPNDQNGYMLLFDARETQSDFYQDILPFTICAGTEVTARVWIADVNIPGSCGGNHRDPEILMTIVDIENDQTFVKPLTAFPQTATLQWVPLELTFTVGANDSQLSLLLSNAGGGGCGNDFAIDDVELFAKAREEIHDLCELGPYTDSRGVSYSTPQTVIDTLDIGQGNCVPSIVCMQLVGEFIEDEPFVEIACLGDTVFYAGIPYTNTAIFSDTISAAPCAVVRPVRIRFGQDTTVSQQINLCPGGRLAIGDNVYTESGVYRDSLLGFAGCDSILETTVVSQDYQVVLEVNGQRIVLEEDDRPAEVQIKQGDSVEMSLLLIGIEDELISWQIPDQFTCVDCPSVWVKGIRSEVLDIEISRSNLSCMPRFSVPIRVLPCEAAYVPNAFSPNQDGINDRFLPFLQDCVQSVLDFQVYDRWGGLIFDEPEISACQQQLSSCGWDGRHLGREVSTGVYVYRLRLLLIDGTELLRSDTVLLMR
ncbi:MAG: gliding motility-associated C-terminal domain-containing protein [Bacteroidota bacterium]